MRSRKTRDTWQLHVYYGYGDRWEHETTEYSFREFRDRIREYRESCPKYPCKLVRKREKIEGTA